MNLVPNLSEWLGAVAVTLIAGISPKFNRRKVAFVYPVREAVVSFVLFGLVWVLAWLTWSQKLSLGTGELEIRALLSALSAAPFLLALLIRRQPPLSVGWGRAKFRQGLQTGLALLFLTIFLRGKFMALLAGISATQAAALVWCAVLAFSEESILRGFIQLRLTGWLGERWGWLLAALLSLLWQLPRLILYSPDSLAAGLLLAAGSALVCGFIFSKTGHTLAPALYRLTSEWMWFLG